jgi:hypothetical protein
MDRGPHQVSGFRDFNLQWTPNSAAREPQPHHLTAISSRCPTTRLINGALASNVSIANASKNGGLGSLNVAPNALVIRVDGAGTKVRSTECGWGM